MLRSANASDVESRFASLTANKRQSEVKPNEQQFQESDIHLYGRELVGQGCKII